MKIAIIDLGSNSARMTVWELSGRKEEVIYNKRIYVRLSEGLAADNMLKVEPMTRTLSALEVFSEVIKALSCDKVVAVATEALRRANNSGEFISEVEAKTGIEIKILSGDDEARYDLLAAKEFVGSSSAFLMDVGGGSIEIIRVDDGCLSGRISVPLSAVVTSDICGCDSDALYAFFAEKFSKLSILDNTEGHFIVGLGGSIRSLFAYGERLYDGAGLSREEFKKLYEKITTMPREELKIHKAFTDRYDIINAGLAPFNVLCDKAKSEKIILCNKGVREGILRECVEKMN